MVELRTGASAESDRTRSSCLSWNGSRKAALYAHGSGLQVNAGRGTDYDNVELIAQVTHLSAFEHRAFDREPVQFLRARIRGSGDDPADERAVLACVVVSCFNLNGNRPARGDIGSGIRILWKCRALAEVMSGRELFLRRVFTEKERAYCSDKRDPAPFYAARFAAKEAVSKAFGTGIGAEIGLQDIEVDHHESGAPFVRLLGGARSSRKNAE